MIIRRARPTDYPAILQLQGENVPEALDESQKRQGFIVSRMNEAQLATINRGIGIWVAEQENQLAGFVCLMPADAQPRPPVVDAMLATLATQSFAGRRCVSSGYFSTAPSASPPPGAAKAC